MLALISEPSHSGLDDGVMYALHRPDLSTERVSQIIRS